MSVGLLDHEVIRFSGRDECVMENATRSLSIPFEPSTNPSSRTNSCFMFSSTTHRISCADCTVK